MSTPPSTRKRPLCHTCGTPMAGHKRPNGSPVCPVGWLSPSPRVSPPREQTPPVQPQLQLRRQPHLQHRPQATLRRRSPTPYFPPPGVIYHRVNPNWVEPESSVGVDDKFSDISLVPTEPVEHVETTDSFDPSDNDVLDSGDEDDRSSVASMSSVSSNPLTITQVFRNSAPLATLFSTSTKDIPAITKVARKNKMAVKMTRAPFRADNIKNEINDTPQGSQLSRQKSWWVVMGRDPDAVSHLMNLHERGAEGQEGESRRPDAYEGVGAYPIPPNHVRHTFADTVFAGLLGGLLAIYLLSIM